MTARQRWTNLTDRWEEQYFSLVPDRAVQVDDLVPGEESEGGSLV